jgi:prophage regulatory protein
MSDRFIDSKAVTEKVCLSKTEIYQRINAGLFPKPISLGPRKVVFLQSEIEAWMQARIDQTDDGEARRSQAIKAVRSRRDRAFRNPSNL